MNYNRNLKWAGILILSYIVLSILHFSIIEKNLMKENPAIIAQYILDNDFTFRVGIILDFVLFFNMLLVSSVLYSILRSINQDMALLGFIFMGIQVTIVTVLELSSFGSLLLAPSASNDSSDLNLLSIIMKLRTSGYAVAMIFYCLSFACFYFLFQKSRFLPKLIATLGVISVSILLVSIIAQILYASAEAEIFVKATSSIVMLHQIITAGWLINKGDYRSGG
jgi:hypothetical protein